MYWVLKAIGNLVVDFWYGTKFRERDHIVALSSPCVFQNTKSLWIRDSESYLKNKGLSRCFGENKVE